VKLIKKNILTKLNKHYFDDLQPEKNINENHFRGYAASCRVKRDEEEDNIKKEIDDLDHRVRREWIITESSRKKYEMLKNQLREYGYR
jgi:hypothetical protein